MPQFGIKELEKEIANCENELNLIRENINQILEDDDGVREILNNDPLENFFKKDSREKIVDFAEKLSKNLNYKSINTIVKFKSKYDKLVFDALKLKMKIDQELEIEEMTLRSSMQLQCIAIKNINQEIAEIELLQSKLESKIENPGDLSLKQLNHNHPMKSENILELEDKKQKLYDRINDIIQNLQCDETLLEKNINDQKRYQEAEMEPPSGKNDRGHYIVLLNTFEDSLPKEEPKRPLNDCLI